MWIVQEHFNPERFGVARVTRCRKRFPSYRSRIDYVVQIDKADCPITLSDSGQDGQPTVFKLPGGNDLSGSFFDQSIRFRVTTAGKWVRTLQLAHCSRISHELQRFGINLELFLSDLRLLLVGGWIHIRDTTRRLGR